MGLAKRFRLQPGAKVRLDQIDPGATPEVADKAEGKKRLRRQCERLDELQRVLYAEHAHALLVVLQGMDASGKDGTVRRVFGPLNPQGIRVTSFKSPTTEELDHDFLWRIHKAVPPRGMIGVFNRSHYEDVLIARVAGLVPEKVWSKRYDQINAFEEVLTASHVHIVKLFLHISAEQQLRRLRDRLDEPDKHWKINAADFEQRRYWDDYQQAYEQALSKCSAPHAPWYVIPADRKWYRDTVVADVLIQTLESLDMHYPPPTANIDELRQLYGP